MVGQIVFEDPIAEHQTTLYQSHGSPESLAGWSQWGPAAVDQYRRDGFIVIRDAIPRDDWKAALAELQTMSLQADPDCRNVAYEGGFRDLLPPIAGSPESDELTSARLAAISQVAPEVRARHVRKFMGFTATHPVLRAVANYEPLRQAITALVGEETRLFQSMALVKPPGGREKPWHQDHAYFDYDISAKVCGVWIALGQVTSDNGAMFMIPGGHRNGPVVHFQRRDWQICDADMAGAQPVALPMEAGDLVIFDAQIPHGTPTNRTEQHRWALQFHYVGKSIEKTVPEYRLSVFGEEGKDVSC